MDFNNKIYGVIKFFNIEIWLTETIVNTWIIIFVLFLFALIINFYIKKFSIVPKGMQNFIEILINLIYDLTRQNLGEKYSYFGGYFFGLFLFLITCNLSGLFCLRPPTADLATTLVLALMSFVLIHVTGIINLKEKYFKSYLEPIGFLLPINIIGEIATPISLAFRLFGNIFGGLVITGMIYNFFPGILKFGFPGVLHIYFDIFSGTLQALIFIMLSMMFIKNKLEG